MRRLKAIKGKKKGRPAGPSRPLKKSTLARKRVSRTKKVASKESPDRMMDRNFREHQYWMVKRREYWRRQFMNLKLR